MPPDNTTPERQKEAPPVDDDAALLTWWRFAAMELALRRRIHVNPDVAGQPYDASPDKPNRIERLPR